MMIHACDLKGFGRLATFPCALDNFRRPEKPISLHLNSKYHSAAKGQCALSLSFVR